MGCHRTTTGENDPICAYPLPLALLADLLVPPSARTQAQQPVRSSQPSRTNLPQANNNGTNTQTRTLERRTSSQLTPAALSSPRLTHAPDKSPTGKPPAPGPPDDRGRRGRATPSFRDAVTRRAVSGLHAPNIRFLRGASAGGGYDRERRGLVTRRLLLIVVICRMPGFLGRTRDTAFFCVFHGFLSGDLGLHGCCTAGLIGTGEGKTLRSCCTAHAGQGRTHRVARLDNTAPHTVPERQKIFRLHAKESTDRG